MQRRVFLGGMAAAATAGGMARASAQTPVADEEARNLATLKRIFDEVYNGQDLTNADQIIAADYVPSTPEYAPGIDAWRTRQKASISDLDDKYTTYSFEITDTIAQGNVVAVRYTFSGAGTDGLQTTYELYGWYEFRDGLITTWV